MAKVVNVVGGAYTTDGVIRVYNLTIAVTANSTVIPGSRRGDLVKTNHATGRDSLFVIGAASTAQYLTNA